MSKSSYITPGPIPAPRDKAFLSDPMIDNLLRALTNLTMEVSVTRERLDTLERYFLAQGGLTAGALDALQIETVDEQARAAERRKLVEAVLGPIAANLAADGTQSR